MIGLGTLINTALVVAGGIAGMLFGRFITPRLQDGLMKATALSVLFVGLAGALGGMLSVADGKLVSGGTAMIVVSLAAGAFVGEWINLEHQIGRFGEWLKYKTGSAGDSSFVDAFVTASLTVSIGAMAIVGSIQDGINADPSTLILKGAIDALLVCIMTASMGKGCIFSAIPVFIFEGSLTLLARLIQPIMSAAAIANLSTVGAILIFCVGVNLIWERTFKVANLLPAVVVAVLFALF